jgi:hypothetical protein
MKEEVIGAAIRRDEPKATILPDAANGSLCHRKGPFCALTSRGYHTGTHRAHSRGRRATGRSARPSVGSVSGCTLSPRRRRASVAPRHPPLHPGRWPDGAVNRPLITLGIEPAAEVGGCARSPGASPQWGSGW